MTPPEPTKIPPAGRVTETNASKYAVEWFTQDPPDLQRLGTKDGKHVCTLIVHQACEQIAGYRQHVGWFRNQEVWEIP